MGFYDKLKQFQQKEEERKKKQEEASENFKNAMQDLKNIKEANFPTSKKTLEKREEKQYQKDRLEQLKRDHIPYCPKCHSTSLTANKKGFGIGKAAAGAIVAGPYGLLAGGVGSRKVTITCLNCGHKFKPER